MTNKELSMSIRKTLKEAGYTSKDISVSVKSSIYDTAAHITIKNPHVNKLDIEKLLKPKYEEYEKDTASDEILQGGNTYLFIQYEYGIFDEVSQEWAATARGLMVSNEEIEEVFKGLYLLNLNHSGNLEIRQQNEKGRCSLKVFDFSHLCEILYKFAEFGTIAI